MIKKVLISLTFITLLSCFSINNLKNNGVSKQEPIKVELVDKFKLIVSFFSPGNGIDRKVLNTYVNFLKTSYPKITYEKIKWGREGELDFCFTLNELEEKQINQFISKSEDILSVSSRVHIYKDSPLKHKSYK